MDVLAAQVREAAEAVEKIAPSPWRYDGRDIFCTRNGAEPHHLLIPLPETWHESQRVPEAVARYIALIDPATVLALVARVTEAEDAQHLLADCQRGRKAAQDEAFRRGDEVDRLTAALASARNALEGVEERTHWNYACTASEAMTLMRGYIREVLARLDGSSDE